MCAIWLLGTRAPLEFLTTLGEASGAAFGATAMVSMAKAGGLGWEGVEHVYMARRARANMQCSR